MKVCPVRSGVIQICTFSSSPLWPSQHAGPRKHKSVFEAGKVCGKGGKGAGEEGFSKQGGLEIYIENS